MNDKVTICVPVFNSRILVSRCIRAALDSIADPCRILVIDNCSTDGTAEEAKQLLRGVAGASIIVNKNNIGRIGNWNKCLEVCETKYLRFALVNDVLMKSSTDILLSHAMANVNVIQVFSKEYLFYDGIAGEVLKMGGDERSHVLDVNATLKQFVVRGCSVGCSPNGILFCAETIKKHGLQFDEKLPFFADYKFNIEAAALGNSVFLSGQSVMVDRSVKGRFFNSGGDGGALLREYRDACDTLEKILKARQISGHDAYQSQYHLFKTWFHPRGGVRPSDCIQAFSSMPKRQFQSLWHLFSSRPRSFLGKVRRRLGIKTKLKGILSPRPSGGNDTRTGK